VQFIAGAAGIPGGCVSPVKPRGVILPVVRGGMEPDYPTLASADRVHSYSKKSNDRKNKTKIRLHTLLLLSLYGLPYCFSLSFFHNPFILNPDLVVDLGTLGCEVKPCPLVFGVKLRTCGLGVDLRTLVPGVLPGVDLCAFVLGVYPFTFVPGVYPFAFLPGAIFVAGFPTPFDLTLLTIEPGALRSPSFNLIFSGFLIFPADIILPFAPDFLIEACVTRFPGVIFAALA
jgi:hypothetical protein